jgi:ADP-ribose pyrophosphatase
MQARRHHVLTARALRERLLGSRTIFEGRILSLRVDDIEAADGHRATREVVATRGAAAILCVDAGDIVFTRQYRHPTGDVLLEIPAGIVDDGEEPADTAARELAEEVGLRPRRVEHLVTYYAAPGFTDHEVSIYYTDDVEAAQAELDPGEVIEVERRPVASVRELLASGEVRDAKTLIALGLLALRT